MAAGSVALAGVAVIVTGAALPPVTNVYTAPPDKSKISNINAVFSTVRTGRGSQLLCSRATVL